MHIFWQRRICEGDRTTPYWFPAQTGGGAIREDRLVLPIPPGTHWSDAKPIVLPGEEQGPELTDQTTERSPAEDVPTRTRRRTKAERTEKKGPYKIARGVLWFGTSSPHPPAQASKAAKRKRPAKAKAPVKNDPHHVAAARELRDRYLEHVNAGQMELTSAAKYDVARTLNTIDGSRQLSVAGRAALESHARPSTPRRLPNAA